MTSFPTGILRFAGDWSAGENYLYGMYVLASGSSYACGAVSDTGTDPTVQPSVVWFPFPPSGGGSPSTWASFPAATNVDLASFDINNVNAINTVSASIQTIEDSTGAVGTAGQVLVSNGTEIIWQDPAGIAPFSYNFYVSNVSGNDGTGDGTIANPWKTIGAALDVAGTIPDTNQISIFLAAGTYTEQVDINRANTFLCGSATSLSTATVINGQIIIDLTSSTLPFVIGGVSSVQVTNIIYRNAVAKNQSFLITDCLIAPDLGTSAMVLTDTSVGGTGDVTVQSCLIYMSDVVAVSNSNVFMNFINTEIKNNPLVTAPTSLIQTTGSGRINMYGCVMTQNSAVSTVSPLINLANTTATTGMTFYNCSLTYTSTASDAGVGGGGKCCIRCSNSANVASIVIFNNLLLCQGATTTNGTPGQFLVLQRTGAGTVSINHGQNSGGTTANHFPVNGGGFTKSAYVTVA
jgi:hypothetical protein